MAKKTPQEKTDSYFESFKAEDLERSNALYRKLRRRIEIHAAASEYEQ